MKLYYFFSPTTRKKLIGNSEIKNNIKLFSCFWKDKYEIAWIIRRISTKFKLSIKLPSLKRLEYHWNERVWNSELRSRNCDLYFSYKRLASHMQMEWLEKSSRKNDINDQLLDKDQLLIPLHHGRSQVTILAFCSKILWCHWKRYIFKEKYSQTVQSFEQYLDKCLYDYQDSNV